MPQWRVIEGVTRGQGRGKTAGQMMDGTAQMATAEFDPAEHPRLFRAALGSFATGVTVVTAAGPDGPVGITANSFASVSLDPPLVLWSPARASRRFADFAAAGHFAIHVLAADQRPLAEAFTRSGHVHDWLPGPHGVPLIAGALAQFLCRTEAQHDGGDHLIIIGRVLAASRRDGAALVFQGGHWGGFTPEG